MKHTIYSGGAVQSLKFSDRDKEVSVGVIEPGHHSFSTDSAERVEVLTGSVEVTIASVTSIIDAGGVYDVPARTQFEISCNTPVAYICRFIQITGANETASLKVPHILERTPALLGAVINGFSDEVLQWRPNPERWSVRMVLAHLAESEVSCFRKRLRQAALAPAVPTLEAYDQWGIFQGGEVLTIHNALTTFLRERAATLDFLRALPVTVLARQCHHCKLGLMTFGELLNEFAFHDMGHVRQVLELCRAHAFYPRMGGWQTYYQVNP